MYIHVCRTVKASCLQDFKYRCNSNIHTPLIDSTLEPQQSSVWPRYAYIYYNRYGVSLIEHVTPYSKVNKLSQSSLEPRLSSSFSSLAVRKSRVRASVAPCHTSNNLNGCDAFTCVKRLRPTNATLVLA